MRKLMWLLLVLALVPVGLFALLIGSGTIHVSSLAMILNVMTGLGGPAIDQAQARQRYRLPAGFSLSLYSAELSRARFLRFTPAGDLLVSRTHAGEVVLLRQDADGDGVSDSQETLLSGLSRPHGLDVTPGWLYVAESHRVGRVPFDREAGRVTGDYEVVIDGLTDNGNHGLKTIRIGADGMLYLAQGSTCNVCEEEDPRRATLMRYAPDGSGGEIIATGLRNSVGFDWSPFDGGLYATDNGRDLLGDDFPPCELNLIEPGRFYGWPYFNGDNVPDPDMGPDPLAGARRPTAPVHAFRAHNAPLGITFLRDTDGWPAEFQRSALVALHGSWNRSEPDGYKVVSLHWTEQGIVERDFLSGFLLDGDVSGRPVDVAQGPDGAVYISDDYAGAIYRVTYDGMGSVAMPPASVSAGEEPAAPWLEDADLEALAAQGRALYVLHDCAACHERGENPALMDGLAQRRSHASVVDVLAAPQPPMPLFPLEEEERRALAVYLLRENPAPD